MNQEEHEKVQELLQGIFDNINNWLVFAEAKNAAIIAFNIACFSILFGIKEYADAGILFYIVCVGMVISSMLALISFLPQMGKYAKNTKGHSVCDNLLFYKDIAGYGGTEYFKAVIKQYYKKDILDSEILKLEKDLSDEITYNATVIERKYRWFGYALKVELGMLILLIAMIIIAQQEPGLREKTGTLRGNGLEAEGVKLSAFLRYGKNYYK